MKRAALLAPLGLAAAMSLAGCAAPEKDKTGSWTDGIPFVRHMGGGAEKQAKTEVAKTEPAPAVVETPPVVETPFAEQAVANGDEEKPSGFAKLAGWFGRDDKPKSKDKSKLPPVTPKDAAKSGKAPPAAAQNNAGPGLFISTARIYEQQGNFAGAAAQYQKALSGDPNNLDALLGYARLLDRQSKFPEATQAYQETTRRHPLEASAHNDLGLCLARQNRTDEALIAMNRAIELQPTRKLYRNNCAKLLVDTGRPEPAFAHLAAVHPPAEAHYNLGYLLTQQGDNAGAAQQFARALELAPQLAEAREWLQIVQPQAPAQPQTPVPAPPSFRDAPAPGRASDAPQQNGPQLGPAAYFPPKRY